jgi:hypothetical protein
MTMLHPSWKLPSWAAVAIVAAAFVVRAGLHGWDFRPQLPVDAIIVVALVAILTLRWFLRRQGWDAPEPDGSARVDGAASGGDGDDTDA